jgi:hypothetical protein
MLNVFVAHAPRRAASTLVSPRGQWCRDESRHGTHECVRHTDYLSHISMYTFARACGDGFTLSSGKCLNPSDSYT